MPQFGPQPNVVRFNPIQNTNVYGLHVPYDRGSTTKLPDIEPGSGRHAETWNGSLINPRGESVALWIHEIEVNLALEGTTAQSRRYRQFFPHSYTQVTMKVLGIVPNNYQYNRLASFVRWSQAWALGSDSAIGEEIKAINQVVGRHYNDGSAILTTQLQILGSTMPRGKTTRGGHEAWSIEGYIKKIEAGASRFEYAKEFEFEFIIAFSNTSPILDDSRVAGSKLLPWLDIFKAESKLTEAGQAAAQAYDQTLPGFVNNLLNDLSALAG